MVRIRTTTSSGKIFLSPFVYTLKKAEKLISSISQWHNTPTYDIVRIKNWPKKAEYEEDEIGPSNIYDKAFVAERSWKSYHKIIEEGQ